MFDKTPYFTSWSKTHRSFLNDIIVQHKKVRSFTGSGLFWIQMGLCTLHSAGVRVEEIQAADI